MSLSRPWPQLDTCTSPSSGSLEDSLDLTACECFGGAARRATALAPAAADPNIVSIDTGGYFYGSGAIILNALLPRRVLRHATLAATTNSHRLRSTSSHIHTRARTTQHNTHTHPSTLKVSSSLHSKAQRRLISLPWQDTKRGV